MFSNAAALGTIQGNIPIILIKHLLSRSVLVEKDKLSFHASRHMTATTFLLIGIIITSILFVFTPVLNQNHTAMAQQQQPNGNSFQIDNVTFSHHTTSVNGIQMH